MKPPRLFKVAVYYNSESRTERGRWSAYTLIFNTAWTGFSGMFEVMATNGAAAKREAIRMARAKTKLTERTADG